MHYARLIAEIENHKAQERKQEGQVLGGTQAGKIRPQQNSYERKPQSRDIISEKIGMNGRQYYRAN